MERENELCCFLLCSSFDAIDMEHGRLSHPEAREWRKNKRKREEKEAFSFRFWRWLSHRSIDALSLFSSFSTPTSSFLPVLFFPKQIWQAVAGDAPTLSRPQFYSSLRLIALAQKKGGVLPDDDARRALMGLGPPLPAPAFLPLAVLTSLATKKPSRLWVCG